MLRPCNSALVHVVEDGFLPAVSGCFRFRQAWFLEWFFVCFFKYTCYQILYILVWFCVLRGKKYGQFFKICLSVLPSVFGQITFDGPIHVMSALLPPWSHDCQPYQLMYHHHHHHRHFVSSPSWWSSRYLSLTNATSSSTPVAWAVQNGFPPRADAGVTGTGHIWWWVGTRKDYQGAIDESWPTDINSLWLIYPQKKTHMCPRKQRVEDVFLFWNSPLLGDMFIFFGGVKFTMCRGFA